MNKETLHFKIGLSGSSDRKSPAFNIFVNNIKFISATISKPANEVEYFEFHTDIHEGDCQLVIELTNKTSYDTVQDINGNIIDDMLLNINSITIEDVDLGALLWTASDYQPVYPEVYKRMMHESGKEIPESVKSCVNLGWNGKWILPFQSPFYMWLLENI